MAASLPSYKVLTSFGGFTHSGTDYHEAQRAYCEAVRKVQEDGDGSASLLCGSRVLERFQLTSRRARPAWLRWLGLG